MALKVKNVMAGMTVALVCARATNPTMECASIRMVMKFSIILLFSITIYNTYEQIGLYRSNLVLLP